MCRAKKKMFKVQKKHCLHTRTHAHTHTHICIYIYIYIYIYEI